MPTDITLKTNTPMSTTKTDDKKDEQEDCKFEPQDT